MKWKSILIIAFLVYVYVKGKNASEKEGIELNIWENFLYGLRVFYKVNEQNELTNKMGIVHPGYRDDPGEEMIDPDPFSFLNKSAFPKVTATMKVPRPAFLISKSQYDKKFGYGKN